MTIMETSKSIETGANTAHTRLPDEFQSNEFVGVKYRRAGLPGFVDDRVRNAEGIVDFAPRKILPDLVGSGIEVSDDYPQSADTSQNIEANVPRQVRGVVFDTLTEIHKAQTEFDVAVTTKGATNPKNTQNASPFDARYPYNHVRETESGHLFEADDTPGAERIKESHRMGTYYEVFPDGSKVTKVVGRNFTVVVGDEDVNIQGTVNLTVHGDCNLLTKGNLNQQVKGDYKLLVEGNYTSYVCGTASETVEQSVTQTIGTSLTQSIGTSQSTAVGTTVSFNVPNLTTFTTPQVNMTGNLGVAGSLAITGASVMTGSVTVAGATTLTSSVTSGGTDISDSHTHNTSHPSHGSGVSTPPN